MNQALNPTPRFPNIHLHGILVCFAGLAGCYAAGLLPAFDAPTNSTMQFLALAAFFFGGAAGFPALIVKSCVDRRWSVIAYGLPVVLVVAYTGLRLLQMVAA